MKNRNKKYKLASEVHSQLSLFERSYIKSRTRFVDFLDDLKRERKSQQLTQTQFSVISTIPRTTVSKIESGNRNATISMIMKYTSALGKVLELQLKDLDYTPTVEARISFNKPNTYYVNNTQAYPVVKHLYKAFTSVN